MPGMLGCFGECYKGIDTDSLIETINPLSLCEAKILVTDGGLLATSWLRNNQILSCRYYEDTDYAACFAGDLISFQQVPWNQIISDLKNERYENFSDLRGTFAIAIFDKTRRCLVIISDRTSQQPIYYSIANNALVYSTAISTFCKLSDVPEFNVDWLHEFLFFNHPIGETTFLQNVRRMPAATILQYDLRISEFSLVEYAKLFERPNSLLGGEEALERALSVFNERVPKYFQKGTEVAVSLTGGLDSRTVLSMAPAEQKGSLKTYTYGVPNCMDLIEASKIASTLKLPHTEILFDNQFSRKIGGLIYETVYLSDGLERINRATLPYVYKVLTNGGQRFPLVITGISGDHLFRDHIMGSGNVPAIISSDMMQIFKKGEMHISKDFFKKAYGDDFNKFEQYIYQVVQNLQIKYGKLNAPESYLSYLIYETTPKHFAGEAAIANNFTTLRSPYWDTDIIKLSYEIMYGTLSFSEFLSKKDKYRERVLQGFLIQNNKYFSDIPIYEIPLKYYSNNNKILFHLNRIIRRGPHKIKSFVNPVPHSPLEDWSNWFNTLLTKEIERIISKDSLLLNYLGWEFLQGIKAEKNVHWLGKVLTAEVILNLIKKRWNK